VRLDFDWSDDGQVHQYCFECRAEAVERVRIRGLTHYDCRACGRRNDRSVVIDPAVRWWLDQDGEYWHESAGIFVRDPTGRFLFFQRTIFPFVLTIPAGHIDLGEDAGAAAQRELAEETGIGASIPRLIGVDDIRDDSCRRGADAHRWHAHVTDAIGSERVRLNDEGRAPVWLAATEALRRDLAPPVRYVLRKYEQQLLGTA
jgi:8-oxo-dGTP pyrophosphatase MutT (NUDIX family)